MRKEKKVLRKNGIARGSASRVRYYNSHGTIICCHWYDYGITPDGIENTLFYDVTF